MIYLRWAAKAAVQITATVPYILAVPVLSVFTASGFPSWGSLLWTQDNPPQGDPVFIERRCWFPGHITGLRGYLNRCAWLWRNPLYGLARKLGVTYSGGIVSTVGNREISDRKAIAGSYFTKYTDLDGKLVAFEYYAVYPSIKGKCWRIKLGWKITTPRFVGSQGYAILCCLINPLVTFGEKK